MSAIFRFKKFNLTQDKSAMKVGTDSVLLGSWTSINNVNRVLDVGSGTGVLSLMIAQRQLSAQIDTIEIDQLAFDECVFNIATSDWSSRIYSVKVSFQDFNPTYKYDLIISNPPYFINSFKSEDLQRNHARHSDSLPFDVFISKTIQLLHDNGRLSIILPVATALIFIEKADTQGLYLTRLTKVVGKSGKEAKRYLMEFEKTKKDLYPESLVIEKEKRHDYTREYLDLMKDFLFLE